MKNLERRVKKALKRSGLVQIDVVKQLGISGSSLYGLLHGLAIKNREKMARVEKWILKSEGK